MGVVGDHPGFYSFPVPASRWDYSIAATDSIGRFVTIDKGGLVVALGNARLSGSMARMVGGFRSFPSRQASGGRPIGGMFRGVPSTFDSLTPVGPGAE